MKNQRFTYETLEELAAECQRRNIGINFAKNIEILYEPFEIGGRKLGNRLAILPMEGSDATIDGKPGELTHRRWKRFAEGGAKLIWGEAAAVIRGGRSNPRQLVVSKENQSALAALVKETRQAHARRFGSDDDLLLGIQLTHAGRHCFEKPVIAFHSPVHDPLSFIDKRTAQRLPEDYPVADDAYLAQLEDSFVAAAVAARDAGFDFVDVKQCHGYLLNELLAARERPGDYGGTFRYRRRFVRNIVRKMRAALGSDILIASRLGVYDGVPYIKEPETGRGMPVDYETPYVWGWGVDTKNPRRESLVEPKKLVNALTGVGVDFFGITAGIPYYNPHIVRPFSRPVEGGYLAPENPLTGVERLFRLTADMQHAFPEVPMVGAGYSWLGRFLLKAAATNVAMGAVSVVGVGRTAFAYPDFASDGRQHGILDSRRICLADSMCSNMLRSWGANGEKIPAGCPVRDSKYQQIYKLVRRSKD
jgi:2,4-dienoyl-CoA reductase-like NADH-dependent reductase (Old Yellow Enzyme family)